MRLDLDDGGEPLTASSSYQMGNSSAVIGIDPTGSRTLIL
jgi:hypothetical protein